MSILSIPDYLKYANIQMAAEAFIRDEKTGLLRGRGDQLTQALTEGNKRNSIFTKVQAEQFSTQWEAVDQRVNTSTGFSGTLFHNKETNEYVISFRSTEFIDDSARDNAATNTLEIKEFGYAFGQISDMEAWYAELKQSQKLPEGEKFSVTGYSLGGHLATAFNILHAAEGRIKEVVTFNGAGVGTVEGNKLAEVIAEFTRLRTSDFSQTLTDPVLRALYVKMKLTLDAGQAVSVGDLAALDQLVGPSDGMRVDPQTSQQAQMVREAVARVTAILGEVDYLKNVSSGDNTVAAPKQIENKEIAQESLDYQMAVLTVKARTDATSLLAGVAQAYRGKATSAFSGLAPQYDVMGDTSPSAVANSQWHTGINTPIFIEDQPLYRGGYVGGAIVASIDKLGLELLPNGYATKDFGDTHSLVLLVDSLSVQNTLLQMLPQANRVTATVTMSQVLRKASFQ